MISQELTDLILEFRKARKWEKYHNPKDLAIAISIEANELLELFLWRYDLAYIDKDKIANEIADIMIFLTYLIKFYGFDIESIIRAKIKKNSQKYPVGECEKKWG